MKVRAEIAFAASLFLVGLVDCVSLPTFELRALDDAGPGDVDATSRDGAATDAGTDVADGSASSYAQSVMTDSPLAYWRLGDAVPPAKDEVGKFPADFSASAGVSLGLNEPGAIRNDSNTAVRFENGNFVFVGKAPAEAFDFAGTASFSIEFWLKRYGGENGILEHFTRRSDATPQGWLFTFNGKDNSGMVAVQFRRGTTSAVSTKISENQFYHFVTTYDGRTLLMFVNGQVVATAPDTSALPASGAWFRLGTADGIGNLFGVLDEVALYNYPLSLPRIKAHYDTAQRQ